MTDEAHLPQRLVWPDLRARGILNHLYEQALGRLSLDPAPALGFHTGHGQAFRRRQRHCCCALLDCRLTAIFGVTTRMGLT